MKKSWISHLLIMLIALQSVVAVADIHLDHPDLNPLFQHEAFQSKQSQQQASDHEFLSELSLTDLEITDLEMTGLSISDDQTPPDSSAAIDCQHCCHCHSPQFNFLGSLFTDPILNDGEKHALDTRNSAPSSLASQLFKPPRA